MQAAVLLMCIEFKVCYAGLKLSKAFGRVIRVDIYLKGKIGGFFINATNIDFENLYNWIFFW